MVKQIAERELKTRYGIFTERMFDNDVIVLTKGDVKNEGDVFCRVHSSCISGHAFGSTECKCLEEMQNSQELIQKIGRGIIIWLEQEGRGNGHLAVMQSQELKNKGMSQNEAYESLGFAADARTFESAADVLKTLGVKSVRLLTGSKKKVGELGKFGINVTGIQRINGRIEN